MLTCQNVISASAQVSTFPPDLSTPPCHTSFNLFIKAVYHLFCFGLPQPSALAARLIRQPLATSPVWLEVISDSVWSRRPFLRPFSSFSLPRPWSPVLTLSQKCTSTFSSTVQTFYQLVPPNQKQTVPTDWQKNMAKSELWEKNTSKACNRPMEICF